MARMTKNQKAVVQKYDSHKLYPLAEACQVVKDITYTKFDATVEISANLGVDPRKANQMIRCVVTLPHKTGTVTMEIGAAVKASKAGKIDFKVDKTGIIHTGIGKVSFSAQQLYENAAEVLNAVAKLKPQALKGTYMKSAALCSTMSPGIKIDLKAFLNKGAE